MLESIAFIFLILLGGLGLLAGAIVLTIGQIKKSKNLKIAGLVLFGLTIFSTGLIFFYYGIMLPNHYDNQEIKYSGLYIVDQSKSFNSDTTTFDQKNYYLRLNENNSFKLDSTPYRTLCKTLLIS